ncbi:hypothetical protein [Orgyia pseudotsugata single capsid nuclopolyhedrovirus]|nr:hypothetical protein [Orgyia pseudotsugata single capsid nuclopolyhedrovirus]
MERTAHRRSLLKIKAVIRWLVIRFKLLNKTKRMCIQPLVGYKTKISMFELNMIMTDHQCRACKSQDRGALRNIIMTKNCKILQTIYEYFSSINLNGGRVVGTTRCLYHAMLHACYDWAVERWRDAFVTELLFTRNLYMIVKLDDANFDVNVNTLCLGESDNADAVDLYVKCINALMEKKFNVNLDAKLARLINDDRRFLELCVKACILNPKQLQNYKLDLLFLSRGIPLINLHELRSRFKIVVDFVRFKTSWIDVMLTKVPLEMMRPLLTWLKSVSKYDTVVVNENSLCSSETASPEIIKYDRDTADKLVNVAWRHNELNYICVYDLYTTLKRPEWKEWQVCDVPKPPLNCSDYERDQYLMCACYIVKHIRLQRDFEKIKNKILVIFEQNNWDVDFVNNNLVYSYVM